MPLTVPKKQQSKRAKQNCSIFFLTIWSLLLTSMSSAEPLFEMPDLAKMIDLAAEHGQIEALVGQRHYSGEPVLGWDQIHHENSETPVYHAYGLGGSGLTLAPAFAKWVSDDVIQALQKQEDKKSAEILVLGAGYIGIFTAHAIRLQLIHEGLENIPVSVVANTFTKGISKLHSDIPEPKIEDNYSSQMAGGWVMPVSVTPFANTALWCEMVSYSQLFWKKLSENPTFSSAVRMTQSLVFYEADIQDEHLKKDKSGIREVNKLCQPALYPEQSFTGRFFTRSLENTYSTPLRFSHVALFNNILEADTNSILAYYTAELSRMNVALIHSKELLTDQRQLINHSQHKKPLIINASGHGATNLFGGTPTWPIRGDLVLLRIPTSVLTDSMKTASEYTYWAGGSKYIFMRYSLDGQKMEVVLGGTFLENDGDLQPRIKTVLEITEFWLSMMHYGHTGTTVTQLNPVKFYSDRVINLTFPGTPLHDIPTTNF